MAPDAPPSACLVVLGGSWVVISGVISPLICIVTLLITPFITTHEPPSRVSGLKVLRNPKFLQPELDALLGPGSPPGRSRQQVWAMTAFHYRLIIGVN